MPTSLPPDPGVAQQTDAPRRCVARRVLRWGGGLALVLLLSARWWDLPLAIWIHQQVPAWLNDGFEKIGVLGKSNRYIVAGLVCYGVGLIGWHHGRRPAWRTHYERLLRGSVWLLSTLAVGGAIVGVLKRGVVRARPELFFEQGIYGLGSFLERSNRFHSFPSSHTFCAVAVAVVLGRLLPSPWRWPLWGLAAAVGLSRLINLEHYLSDVMAAAAIAIATAYCLAPRVLDPRYQWPLRMPWRWWSKRP